MLVTNLSAWPTENSNAKRLPSGASRPLAPRRYLATLTTPGNAASSAYRERVAAAGRRSSSTFPWLGHAPTSSLCPEACFYTAGRLQRRLGYRPRLGPRRRTVPQAQRTTSVTSSAPGEACLYACASISSLLCRRVSSGSHDDEQQPPY
jgi:hypothetical protein